MTRQLILLPYGWYVSTVSLFHFLEVARAKCSRNNVQGTSQRQFSAPSVVSAATSRTATSPRIMGHGMHSGACRAGDFSLGFLLLSIQRCSHYNYRSSAVLCGCTSKRGDAEYYSECCVVKSRESDLSPKMVRKTSNKIFGIVATPQT